MKRFKLQCVHRLSGNEFVELLEAEDQTSAFAEVARRDLLVKKVLKVDEMEPEPALIAESQNPVAAVASRQKWERGSAFASVGQLLVILGLIAYPLALVGCILGTVAAERTMGRRGQGVAIAGAIVVTLETILLMIFVGTRS